MNPASPAAVVMGCSAGGLAALRVVLGGLQAQLPAAVVVVCHTGSEDIDTLVGLLARYCALPVEEAGERRRLVGGTVHVAPSGYHLYVEQDRRFSLSVDPKVCFVRPSIDVLFESAAQVFESNLAAVVMTGANDDGALGLRAVRAHGGLAIVQDPAEAMAAVMPATALRVAGADHVCSLAGIAPLINQWCA
ncbi:MAG: Chemotaxis response regulator containing a CheY-like receiver domain and a methylesterase domain [Nevskia sp.]|nr:Chemotaxis response regulator containing a CheY-like receiver domain and a methylesterase domain [Nevskia sp.]